MSCSGRYASAEDYAAMWCVTIDCDGEQEATINNYLDLAASDIHAALAASGQCDCTLAGWAEQRLKKLNVVIAVIYHRCPCGNPRINDEQRALYMQWVSDQLTLIRESKIELCAGETGADFPYTGAAEQGTTEFARREIVVNDYLRNLG